jgi:hypothetical protein
VFVNPRPATLWQRRAINAIDAKWPVMEVVRRAIVARRMAVHAPTALANPLESPKDQKIEANRKLKGLPQAELVRNPPRNLLQMTFLASEN